MKSRTSEWKRWFFNNEDGNPARDNINKLMVGVKASANSDVMYFFTSAQDGDPLQDDVRLCLGDDLKKAQDHRIGDGGVVIDGKGGTKKEGEESYEKLVREEVRVLASELIFTLPSEFKSSLRIATYLDDGNMTQL
ncbi:hypothetical protein Tco_0971567 [Tanacetum coccineum]